jgi:hypothetical protein
MFKILSIKKRSYKRSAFIAVATLSMVFGALTPSEARVELVTSQSYVNENGCIIIVETYQHSFLGIDLWTTTEESSPNCD